MSKHRIASTPESDHIGGWPKILDEEPNRPYEILGPEHNNPENEPHDINYDARRIFRNTENVYAVMEVFISFHERGLYPPKWSLDYLAEKFRKHMANPDPDLLASQLGASGRGSGAANPFDEYKIWNERWEAIGDMSVLVSGFEITLIDAARAIVEKRQLRISPKTLLNDFRDRFGDTQRMR